MKNLCYKYNFSIRHIMINKMSKYYDYLRYRYLDVLLNV